MAAVALNRENYFWHKIHSLTGVIPVGFYMVQHLTLNSFSLAGPAYFDRVIGFFEQIPKHLLLGMEIFLIWIPLAFHAIYGFFIVHRGMPAMTPAYAKYREHRYYTLQRWSGIAAFVFLLYHVFATTVQKYLTNNVALIEYEGMQRTLTSNGYLITVVYAIGILAATYHFAYGLWSFCIRWGITVSEKAQARMWKFSNLAFVALLVLGWGALGGFLFYKSEGHDNKPAAADANRGPDTVSSEHEEDHD